MRSLKSATRSADEAAPKGPSTSIVMISLPKGASGDFSGDE